ncbi:MAG: MGMT family protein [Bacteroidota bacterium]|nr:MGMT family protein [Bacteroidota bacterium]MEC7954535.1 MGMT family protein [Bacteroidota bacterium]MED5302605.1 MGMT family protein [Bacteroidota bacterium]
MQSNFFLDVVDVVRLIPKGKVTTYGSIAKYLGSSRSSRMVGWILNKQVLDATLPAHRVVNRKGILTGKNHFENPFFMQSQLEKEGIKVVNDQIVDFNYHFWDPNKELTI